MTVPTEQQVLTAMNAGSDEVAVEAVADLLRQLGYVDIAKELLMLFDTTRPDEEIEF